MTVVGFTWGDLADLALAIFLFLVGLGLAWMFLTLGGTLLRVTTFIKRTERELLPVITNAGVLVGYMFTSAVLVEAVFSWPGVGTMMIHAVENRDYPVLQAGAFIVASVFVVVNWVVDALYGIIDPRIR